MVAISEHIENHDNLDRLYVYGNYIDEVLLMDDGTNDYYYAHNHLFSTTALLDNTGTIVERYEYDAYGKLTIWNSTFTTITTTSPYNNPYTFTGRRLDTFDSGDLKIMYYRNRYYSTEMGRFMTHDPLGHIEGNNLYEYATSNSVSWIDPSGLLKVNIGPEVTVYIKTQELIDRKFTLKGPEAFPLITPGGNSDDCECNEISFSVKHKLLWIEAKVTGKITVEISIQPWIDIKPDKKIYGIDINSKVSPDVYSEVVPMYTFGEVDPPIYICLTAEQAREYNTISYGMQDDFLKVMEDSEQLVEQIKEVQELYKAAKMVNDAIKKGLELVDDLKELQDLLGLIY